MKCCNCAAPIAPGAGKCAYCGYFQDLPDERREDQVTVIRDGPIDYQFQVINDSSSVGENLFMLLFLSTGVFLIGLLISSAIKW